MTPGRRSLSILLLLGTPLLCGCSVFGQRPGRVRPLLATDAVKQPFAAVVADCNRSVLRLCTDDGAFGLSTVVAADQAVAVASMLPAKGTPMRAIQGERVFAVTVLGIDAATDLALLQLAEAELPPIAWAASPPRPGALLASPDGGRLPAGIGMLSTGVYVHSRPRGFLGVMLAAAPSPVLLENVLDGSAAAVSGLRAGDEVLAIDDQAVADANRFRNLVGRRRPGESVQLRVRRDGAELTLDVELQKDRRGDESDQQNVWGPLSAVRAGFGEVLQHDTVLRPELCGGPVVDLDGRCVGVNVSRAGRVETLALPAAVVREAVARLQERYRTGALRR